MKHIERSATLVAAALALFASVTGCADSGAAQGDEGSSSEHVGLEAPFNLRGVSLSDGAALGATQGRAGSGPIQKVAHGAGSNFDEVIGNTSVQITSQNGVLCTAQVINKNFLLTAGHCVAKMLPDGQGWIQVSFTDTSGNPFILKTTWTHGRTVPGGQVYDKDIGLIYLFEAIDTCQDTILDCYYDHVNAPMNALFQIFYPGFDYIAPSYAFAGYGTTDDFHESGRLRVGILPIASSEFTDNDQGHKVTAPWAGTAPRPCEGDSGGALLSSQFDRVVHTGALSMATTCTMESGSVDYAGLTYSQAQWVLDVMASVTPPPDPAYHCTMATTGMPNGAGLLVFGCDNDGTVFP